MSKNGGRRTFQIHLAIALLNKGISMDWKGDKRPDYMRQTSSIPCNCEMCYFCINGYTSGIAHAGDKCTPDRMSIGGKKVKVDKCTEERVTLLKYEKLSDYCRMCYAGFKENGMNAKEKRNAANKSSKKCGYCKVLICEECWKDYDHNL